MGPDHVERGLGLKASIERRAGVGGVVSMGPLCIND
jgi:hypothetical protein